MSSCLRDDRRERPRAARGVKRLDPRCLLLKPIDLTQLLRGLDAAQ